MKQFVNKLFNIRPEEWPRVIISFLLLTITNTGAIWGATITYAALLEQLGLGALPWIFALSALLSILASIVYTVFVDRIANTTLFIIIYVLGILSILLGLGLLWLDLPKIAYPLLYLLLLMWITVYNPHFVTYISNLYDTQAAKRILPVVSAGDQIGAILGGVTMALFINRLSHNAILVIWLLTYLVSIGLVGFMPYFFKKKLKSQRETVDYTLPSQTPVSKGQFALFIDSMKEGFRYTLQSPYLRWIAAGTLLLMILMTLLEYESSGILLNIYGTAEQLADFLARLVSIGNFVALPLLLFVVSRLIGRLGVGNASMIFPIGNLLVCAGLILVPGWGTAVAAYFNYTAFQSIFQAPIGGLLFNAVPMRVKGRANAFIGGLIIPLGSLLGGLLLLLPLSAVPWFTAVLIGVTAVAYLISAWFTRQHYSRALVKMLEQEDYSFVLSQEASKLIVTDPRMLAQLQTKLEASTSHEITIFMAQLISQIGGREAIPILDQTARKTENARTRAALVDVVIAADIRSDKIHQLCTDLLSDPDGQVRASALTGLQRLSGGTDKQFLSQALSIVQDQDLDVRELALSILAKAGNFDALAPAVDALDELLSDTDPYRRACGIRVLGKIGDERAAQQLLTCLTDPADEVRLETALALETLSQGHTFTPAFVTELEQKTRALLKDPIERARRAALFILGQIKQRSAYQAVADALNDPSPEIRATATDMLVQGAKSVIPIVHSKLNASDSQVRKMAAVTLSRIDPKEFGALIAGTYITGNLLSVYRNHGLAEALDELKAFPSTAILQSNLRERSQQSADEIFYLLGAIHDPSAVKIIHDSLKSDSSRARANAVEALESLTTPKTANLITPLFEPNIPTGQLLAVSRETWDMEQPDSAQAIRQLVTQTEDPWLRAMTVFTLGEIGTALSPRKEVAPRETATPEETPATTKRRRPPTDLLGALGDAPKTDEAAKKEESPPTPERRTRRAAMSDLLGAIGGETTPQNGAPATDALKPDGAAEPPRRERRAAPKDLFGALESPPPTTQTTPPEEKAPETPVATSAAQLPFTLLEIETMLATALSDPVAEVRQAAQTAKRLIAGVQITDLLKKKEEVMLSAIEKIIFLKEVPFFQSMTIDQLKVLASVCEEEVFEEDQHVFDSDDPGGAIYVVVNGRVGIEQEKRAGSFARLATIQAHSYFGETNFFDNSPRSTSAIAIQDTLTLRLRREPLIALARQHPDMSLALINVLSERLREANDRIADLTRSRPRQLNKLFDQYD
jgi:HEAT repeat protein/ATP/ADP translocase